MSHASSSPDYVVADGTEYKNILIVRTDRIGDVVLSLPLVEVLRKNFPPAHITFLARTYTRDIVEGQPGVDAVALYDEEGKPKSFFRMFSELRRPKYDLAVVAFPRFRIALLLRLAGVTTRVGTGYRWYSFLFNERVFEHRKNAAKHEFEFNLSLAQRLGCRISPGTTPHLHVDVDATRVATEERKRLGLSAGRSFVVLHPGSGGSARDWSPANFRALAIRFRELGWKVVVTGAMGEEELVRTVTNDTGSEIVSSVGRLSLKELAAFIKSANLFVSNSTGPLHIAAGVGTPVIGFYPPIVACSPQRWGPVTEKKIVFVPDNAHCRLCHGEPCRGNICMDQINVEQVVQAAMKLIKKRSRGKPRTIAVYS